MVRYTLLRLLIFFGFVLLFWVIGLRGESDLSRLLLIASAAVASSAVSYVVLRGMRDEMTGRLVERHEARLRAKSERQTSPDELAEDAEVERDR